MSSDDQYHNQQESGSLSLAEHETVEAGRLAIMSLHKTLDLWVAVARAIKTLRDKADRLEGRQTFKRLMAQNGFRMEGTPHEKVIDKGVVSKLLAILDRLPEVMAWYGKLTPKQKREWAAPTTVYKHCPVFAKAKAEPKPGEEPKLTKLEQTEGELVKALQEIEVLKKREDGDTFNAKTTSPREMATALFGQLQPYPGKLEKLYREIGLLIGKAKSPKKKAQPDHLHHLPEREQNDDGTPFDGLRRLKPYGALEWEQMPCSAGLCGEDSWDGEYPGYTAKTAAGEYSIVAAMGIELSGGKYKFAGYMISYLPTGVKFEKRDQVRNGVKTAEQAKAVAQRHYDKQKFLRQKQALLTATY